MIQAGAVILFIVGEMQFSDELRKLQSAADAKMVVPLLAVECRGFWEAGLALPYILLDPTKWGNLKDYIQHLLQNPAQMGS